MLGSFLSGALSILSPCVLPLIPVLMSSSLTSQRKSFGFLLLGFFSSFTILGIAVTLVSKAFLDFDPEWVRYFGAVLMIFMAIAMLIPVLQRFLEKTGLALEGLSKRSTPQAAHRSSFFNGMTLSMIWAPCAGPALGVALGWVAATDTLGKGAFHLSAFGLGASGMLGLLGALTKKFGTTFMRKHSVELRWTYKISSIVLLVVALAVLTRVDRQVEGWLSGQLPMWWIDIVNKY